MTRKTLFITGASTGIGRATALAAAAADWNVALLARSADKLAELAAGIGPQALALPGDVTDRQALTAAAAQAADHFGGIDAGFANAGRGSKAPGTEAGDPEDWRGMVDINIMGVLLTTHALLPHLRKSRGTLVLTGSSAGRKHMPGSVYGATKWFVHGYAGNLSLEMHEWGGRCGVVAPGYVETPFFEAPLPGKLQPEDVAAAVMTMISAPPHASIREIFLLPQN